MNITDDKVWGVTHRGTDAQSIAYMENERVWIPDCDGGWIRCNPGVESYFSPDELQSDTLTTSKPNVRMSDGGRET